jgi:hypothetical protein
VRQSSSKDELMQRVNAQYGDRQLPMILDIRRAQSRSPGEPTLVDSAGAGAAALAPPSSSCASDAAVASSPTTPEPHNLVEVLRLAGAHAVVQRRLASERRAATGTGGHTA